MNLKLRFLQLLQSLQCIQSSEWFAELIAAYQQPQRHYHTLEHLSECLSHFDRYRKDAVQPAEVEYALWFHDAVYELHATDNEQRSAQWAVQILQDSGIAQSVQQRVRRLILATQHGAVVPQTADEKLVVDIDLSIFATSATRFAAYQQQIRTEYQTVPDVLYYQKRLAVLKHFLIQQPLYHTPSIRADLEATARFNLQTALRDFSFLNSVNKINM